MSLGIRELPKRPGIYTLVIHVPSRIAIQSKSRAWVLEPGYYVYVGSAGGPGGLAARLRRHFLKDKKVFWHIDRLTVLPQTRIIAIALSVGSYGVLLESRIASCLEAIGLNPIPGFGASDDPAARTHLYYSEKLSVALKAPQYCLEEATGEPIAFLRI